jgi:hypothetical protein
VVAIDLSVEMSGVQMSQDECMRVQGWLVVARYRKGKCEGLWYGGDFVANHNDARLLTP